MSFELTVSIIMPLHNAADFVEDAIKSVLAQTRQDWELVIIDDKSSDNSADIVNAYSAKDSRIRLVKLEQNSGAAAARNKGLELAQGRYIAFLDSDDFWLPEKLEKQLAFMQKTNSPFTYTAYEKVNDSGHSVGKIGVPKTVNYSQLLKTCYLGCLTVMLDRRYFGEVRMPLIRRRQDYGLWLRLLKQVDFASGLNEVLGRYRVHNGSISSNKMVTATYTWRLYRDIENLGLVQSTYYFLHYSIRGVLRHRFPNLARKLGILHRTGGA